MPTLYVIRGLPGSGKSTLAQRLVHPSRHREADMFFMREGRYLYDAGKIKDAHRWCESEIRKLMKESSDCAVSNTFTRRWEYQPYLDMAADAEFCAQVIECHGPWNNVHDVPGAVLAEMRHLWEPHRISTKAIIRAQDAINAAKASETRKTPKASDLYSTMPSALLRVNQGPGSTPEKLRRAMAAIIVYNSIQPPEKRYKLSAANLRKVSSCRHTSVVAWMAENRDEIDAYNAANGLTGTQADRGKTSIEIPIAQGLLKW